MTVNPALWLSFTNPTFEEASRNEFRANLALLQPKVIHGHEALDFESFRAIENGRPLREFDNFCHVRFQHGTRTFTSQAWGGLFRISEPTVREYVHEFISSVKFRVHTLELELPDTLVFQLGGARKTMTLKEFTLALGLYTEQEMNSNLFSRFRENCIRRRPNDFNPMAYVYEITNQHHYDPKHSPSYTTIETSFRRLAHRLIACSITGRHFGKEKVTLDDLFFLHSMDGGELVDVPWNVANYLVEKAKGSKTKSMICGAHFISRIARHYGLMEPNFIIDTTNVLLNFVST